MTRSQYFPAWTAIATVHLILAATLTVVALGELTKGI